MIARKGAHVVVADAGGATIFRIANRVNGVKLDDVAEMDAEPLPRSSDVGRDAPPRVTYSTGHTSALEMTDLHDAMEARFAQRVADRMEDLVGGSPKGLILFAPPRFLGMLRPRLSARVQGGLKAEVAKDVRKLRLADLEREIDLLDRG
jgi:protein required for attachment to host cells